MRSSSLRSRIRHRGSARRVKRRLDPQDLRDRCQQDVLHRLPIRPVLTGRPVPIGGLIGVALMSRGRRHGPILRPLFPHDHGYGPCHRWELKREYRRRSHDTARDFGPAERLEHLAARSKAPTKPPMRRIRARQSGSETTGPCSPGPNPGKPPATSGLRKAARRRFEFAASRQYCDFTMSAQSTYGIM